LVSMDPNPYEVTEPELLRGLRLSGRAVSSRTTPDSRSVLTPFASVTGPVGSSRVRQGTKGLDLNRSERFPSRPSASPTTEVSRTGSSRTLTLLSDTADDSSTSAATEQEAPTFPSDTAYGSSRSVATERNDRCTGPVPPLRLLGRRWSRDPALLPTCSPSHGSAPPRPIPWTKCLLYNARDVGPRRPDVPPPSTSCTAPPGPSRPIRLQPRPGDPPDLPAIHDRPFRPSSRSLSR